MLVVMVIRLLSIRVFELFMKMWVGLKLWGRKFRYMLSTMMVISGLMLVVLLVFGLMLFRRFWVSSWWLYRKKVFVAMVTMLVVRLLRLSIRLMVLVMISSYSIVISGMKLVFSDTKSRNGRWKNCIVVFAIDSTMFVVMRFVILVGGEMGCRLSIRLITKMSVVAMSILIILEDAKIGWSDGWR